MSEVEAAGLVRPEPRVFMSNRPRVVDLHRSVYRRSIFVADKIRTSWSTRALSANLVNVILVKQISSTNECDIFEHSSTDVNLAASGLYLSILI